uniref:Uncharacterized protein n=1 Tax=Salix viminalis TaxID=40686 RepID=A0A6N2NH44_SALVM
MKCASYQLGKHGIRVNCVSPGPVATPMMCKLNNMGVEEGGEALRVELLLERGVESGAYSRCCLVSCLCGFRVCDRPEFGGVKGSIICTASTAANLVASTVTDYIMAKCGVVALMKCASYQLGKHGIRVNCVSPGPVATPMVCEANNMGVEELEKLFVSICCLKGVLKAKHIADAVLFLASTDSEFVTGQNLMVDGGYAFQGAVN